MSTACPDPAQRGQLSVDVSGKLAVKNDILKKTTASKGYVVACWACGRRCGMLMTQSQPRQHELHFPQHLAPKVPQRVQLDSGTTQQYLSCPSCLFPDRACKRERYRKEGDNIALNWEQQRLAPRRWQTQSRLQVGPYTFQTHHSFILSADL